MSSRCRVCFDKMPKDRKGWEQVCPKCKKVGYKEWFERNFYSICFWYSVPILIWFLFFSY